MLSRSRPVKKQDGVHKISLTDIIVLIDLIAVLKIYRNCIQPVDVVVFYKS